MTYTLRICYADKIRPPCRKIELLKVKQAVQACRPRMNTPRKRLQKPRTRSCSIWLPVFISENCRCGVCHVEHTGLPPKETSSAYNGVAMYIHNPIINVRTEHARSIIGACHAKTIFHRMLAFCRWTRQIMAISSDSWGGRGESLMTVNMNVCDEERRIANSDEMRQDHREAGPSQCLVFIRKIPWIGWEVKFLQARVSN